MIDSSGVGRFCGPTGGLFTLGHVGRSLVATRPPLLHESAAGSRTLQLHRVVTPELRGCARLRFVALHYPRLCERSGERLHYAVTDAQGFGWRCWFLQRPPEICVSAICDKRSHTV